MGRNNDSPLTVLKNATMPNGSPVLTDVERIRLFQFLNDGIKIENIVARKINAETELLGRGDRYFWGAGKLTDTTNVIDNPGIFAGMTLRVMGSRMGVGVSKIIQKLPFMGSSGAELIAASAGARALQEAVQGTPMVAYKTLIFQALSDKDLYTSMMKLGKTSKENFRLAWSYKSALASLGIQVATPETSLIPEDDPSIEERARLRSELYGPGVIRREDVKDPFLRKPLVPRSTRDAVPPPPPPTVVPPAVPAVVPPAVPASAPAPSPQANAQRQRFKAQYPFDFGMELVPPAQPAAQQPAAPPRFQAGFAAGGPVKRKRPGILGLA